MPGMTIALAIFAAAVAAAALACRRQALLNWYLWEVRRREVPLEPGQRIQTYPLA